ncbi:hypothetical protein HU200_031475 [Digitaria exilis]|uniref:Uncharacterized protein n=1 Tax=Digitaria exilis TaxID=1010633 RepID=A0A835BPS9_9POAL|nr:hypothetical protein HU200_031475 [Digitaria exilis]
MDMNGFWVRRTGEGVDAHVWIVVNAGRSMSWRPLSPAAKAGRDSGLGALARHNMTHSTGVPPWAVLPLQAARDSAPRLLCRRTSLSGEPGCQIAWYFSEEFGPRTIEGSLTAHNEFMLHDFNFSSRPCVNPAEHISFKKSGESATWSAPCEYPPRVFSREIPLQLLHARGVRTAGLLLCFCLDSMRSLVQCEWTLPAPLPVSARRPRGPRGPGPAAALPDRVREVVGGNFGRPRSLAGEPTPHRTFPAASHGPWLHCSRLAARTEVSIQPASSAELHGSGCLYVSLPLAFYETTTIPIRVSPFLIVPSLLAAAGVVVPGAAAAPAPPPTAAALLARAAAARLVWTLNARIALAAALFVLGCCAAALAFFAMTSLPPADSHSLVLHHTHLLVCFASWFDLCLCLGTCAPTEEEAADLRAASQQLLLAASAQVLGATAAWLVPAPLFAAPGCLLGGLTAYRADEVIWQLVACHGHVHGAASFHYWLFVVVLLVVLLITTRPHRNYLATSSAHRALLNDGQ